MSFPLDSRSTDGDAFVGDMIKLSRRGALHGSGPYPDAVVTIAYITNTDERRGPPDKVSAALQSLRTVSTESIFAT